MVDHVETPPCPLKMLNELWAVQVIKLEFMKYKQCKNFISSSSISVRVSKIHSKSIFLKMWSRFRLAFCWFMWFYMRKFDHSCCFHLFHDFMIWWFGIFPNCILKSVRPSRVKPKCSIPIKLCCIHYRIVHYDFDITSVFHWNSYIW